jgi:hypothetical protein
MYFVAEERFSAPGFQLVEKRTGGVLCNPFGNDIISPRRAV